MTSTGRLQLVERTAARFDSRRLRLFRGSVAHRWRTTRPIRTPQTSVGRMDKPDRPTRAPVRGAYGFEPSNPSCDRWLQAGTPAYDRGVRTATCRTPRRGRLYPVPPGRPSQDGQPVSYGGSQTGSTLRDNCCGWLWRDPVRAEGGLTAHPLECAARPSLTPYSRPKPRRTASRTPRACSVRRAPAAADARPRSDPQLLALSVMEA